MIAGAGGWRLWLDHKMETAAQANVRYDAAAQLLAKGDGPAAKAAFDEVAKAGPAGYVGIASLRAAQAQALTDPEGAAKSFDDLAGDTALGQGMQDAARTRGAIIRIDRDDPKAFDQRYGRFSVQGFAFRNTMRELLALAALKRQDFDAARKYLSEIIGDSLAPPALRNRAQAFMALVQAGPATPTSTAAPAAALAPVEPATPVPLAPPAASLPTPPAPSLAGPSPAAPPAATVAPPPAAPAPSSPAK